MIEMKKDFVFRSDQKEGFSKNLTKFIEEDDRNIILRCCNVIEYGDIVSFCKEINCSKNKSKFTQEREFRGAGLLEEEENIDNHLFGDESYEKLNIVFMANHKEYLDFMKNENIRKKMLDNKEHNSFFIIVIADTFDPLDSLEASFLYTEGIEKDTGEEVKLKNIEDDFLVVNIEIFKERTTDRRTDLSDIISPDMKVSYFAHGLKGLSPNKKWELVNVFDLDQETINELISTGVLDGTPEDLEHIQDSFNFLEINISDKKKLKIKKEKKKANRIGIVKRFKMYIYRVFSSFSSSMF